MMLIDNDNFQVNMECRVLMILREELGCILADSKSLDGEDSGLLPFDQDVGCGLIPLLTCLTSSNFHSFHMTDRERGFSSLNLPRELYNFDCFL